MKLKDRIRHLNKRFLNRFTAKLAQAGVGPMAMVYHTGRRSGKHYETPIFVFLTGDGFVIALTYGPKVDWYQNIRAANSCQVLYHHRVYVIDQVFPVERASALPLFPQPIRSGLTLMGINDFARMKGQAVQTA